MNMNLIEKKLNNIKQTDSINEIIKNMKEILNIN